MRPCSLAFLTAAALSAQTSVLTYHNDNLRTGQNLAEAVLTPANVNQQTFGKLFTYPVDGKVDAQPLVVAHLHTPTNRDHTLVFAATEHDRVYAFDAHTGATAWHVSLLKSGETPSDTRSCDQVTPEIGITATPVIDPQAGPHGAIYVVAMSKDGANAYHQRLHALDRNHRPGTVRRPRRHPGQLSGSGDNASNGAVVFDPKQYKTPALLLVNGIVYTAWGSHCDIRPYTGWTIGYDQLTLKQKGVFNFTPNGSAAGLWGAGGGVPRTHTATYFTNCERHLRHYFEPARFPSRPISATPSSD